MSETNIDSAVIKRTQDSLGKFVKKPALTEKLLKRPPFRFLHDIINAVIKDTGYFNGLFTDDELNSDNIKDRDGKIHFLQKLVDVINVTRHDQLSVRPSKIVAGQEAEKTNKLLQEIARIIENKVDLSQAIEIVRNGKTSQHTKIKSKKSKESQPTKKVTNKESPATVKKSPIQSKDLIPERSNEIKTQNKNKMKTTSDENKKVKKISKENSIEVKNSKKIDEDKKINAKEKPSKTKLSENDKKKSSQNRRNLPTDEGSKKSVTLKDDVESSKKSTKKTKKLVGKQDQEQVVTVEDTEIKLDEENLISKPRKSSNSSIQDIKPSKLLEKTENQIDEAKLPVNSSSKLSNKEKEDDEDKFVKPEHNEKHTSATEKLKVTDEILANINSEKDQNELEKSENVASSSTQKISTISSRPDTSNIIKPQKEIKRQSTFVREQTSIDRPKTSLRPPSVRPPSARPGAPRRRDKNVEIILEPNDKVNVAGIDVQLESFNNELEDDGETLVIIDSSDVTNQSDSKHIEENAQAIGDDEQQKGHLVQQILETQKELVQANSTKIENSTEDSDTATLQKRQSSAKQMSSLRDMIQNLTRSINPLGKLLDFIPEHIDSMQLELNMWRDTYLQASSDLKRERMLTDSSLDPLKIQLDQIDSNIKEHKQMINAVRAKILLNSQKITSLLLE